MKKLINVLVLFALLFSAVVTADAKDNGGKFFQLGVKGGVDYTGMKAKDLLVGTNFKNYTGFNAGLAFRFNLPLGFEIQPELLYTQTGTKISTEIAGATLESLYKNGAIRVPINIQWGFTFIKILKPYVIVSPYVGASLVQTFSNVNLSTTEDLNEYLSRFQYGIGLGFGLNVWRFQASFKWNWDLGNQWKESLPANYSELKNNISGFEVSLAFFIF